MTKRHQASRRKSYGRRQHELRQRSDRHALPALLDAARDEPSAASPADGFAFLDPRVGRIHFALGD